MGDGSSRDNLFKTKRKKLIEVEDDPGTSESVVPSHFSIHAQVKILKSPILSSRELYACNGHDDSLKQGKKHLAMREVWNRPLTPEQQTESTAMQEWT